MREKLQKLLVTIQKKAYTVLFPDTSLTGVLRQAYASYSEDETPFRLSLSLYSKHGC